MIILYRDQQRSGNVFMEKRYRGYPPEVKKVPWMLYRREEQSAGPVLVGDGLSERTLSFSSEEKTGFGRGGV